MNTSPAGPEALENELQQIPDPETGRPIGKTGQLLGWDLESGVVSVEIGLTTWSLPLQDRWREETAERIRQRVAGCHEVQITLSAHQRPVPEMGTIGLRCRSIIAVGSGKGGVGKSTVAATLALGLKRAGCRVGLMDADVYGPSIPNLIGVDGQPAKSGERIAPIDADGMPVMSIGFMVPVDQAVIWRGPMLHSAVTQFLRDTDWGELDYLIIDMPPGTGDVALTLSQLVPATGAIVVCTPQKVALLDAIKALSMFEKVKIPVTGIVENMSSFLCPDTGKSWDIFGKGGARRLAEQTGVPCLAELPINIGLRERGDAGTMEANFDDPLVAGPLDSLVINTVASLADRAADNPPTPSLPVLG